MEQREGTYSACIIRPVMIQHRSFLIANMDYIITMVTIKTILITILTTSLEARVGNMRRILCSDRLLERVR